MEIFFELIVALFRRLARPKSEIGARPMSEEERIRKFMEALGLPATSAPPPTVPKRVTKPTPASESKRKVRPIDPFPRPRSGPWKPQPVIVTESAPTLADQPAAAPVLPQSAAINPIAPAPPFEVGAAERPTETWASRLANPAGLRDAIVLREIFGPPRGLA